MSTSVLLTGGSGFVGSVIAQSLAARGATVHAPRSAEMNLRDPASVRAALERYAPEVVVHSAAYYGGLGIVTQEPLKMLWYNVSMTAGLFEALQDYPQLKKSVVVGSACAYPGDVAGDMSEDDFWSGPLHASVEPYGFTKKVNLAGQRAMESMHGATWAHPVITNLYGPGDVFTEYRSHVVAALIKKFADATLEGRREVVLWGTGAPIREFLHAFDAADAIAHCALSDYQGVVNIGTGVGTTIRELAEVVREFTGFQGELVWDADKPDGVMRKVLDVSRMRDGLGWAPEYDLRRGLEQTITWYLANKDTADARG